MRSLLAAIVGSVPLACAVAAQGFAQDKPLGKDPGSKVVQIGPVIGMNFFTLAGSDASGMKTRSALYAGTALTVPLGVNTFLQPELLYSAEGAKVSVTDSSFGTIDGTYELAYLAVPVLFGVRLARGRVEPRLFAGPVLNVNLVCDLEASAQGQSSSMSCADASLTAKTLTFGATAGGDLAFRSSWGTFTLSARYAADLTHAFDDSNVRNRGVSVGAGLSILLPR